MNIFEFERIARSEREARGYLLDRCAHAADPRCPACSRSKLYSIEKGKRRRCAQCGHTFNPFSERWLNEVKISSREWLWIVKLFELERPATVIADEVGISYPTALKAINTIRMSVAPPATGDGAMRGAAFINASPGITGFSKEPAHAGGSAPFPQAPILLQLNMNGDYLILADRNFEFSSVSCCGRSIPLVDLGKNYPHCRVYCSAGGFWPYAKERLVRHHGISFPKLPLYLREMEFRWTHRHGNLFESIIDRLCALMRAASAGDTVASDESRTAPHAAGRS